MPQVKKDGKTYHFPYTSKGIGEASKMKGSKKAKKKKTMFSKGSNE